MIGNEDDVDSSDSGRLGDLTIGEGEAADASDVGFEPKDGNEADEDMVPPGADPPNPVVIKLVNKVLADRS